MPKGKKSKSKTVAPKDSYLERVSSEVNSNQSKLSMVLGALIILVVGVLIFNYFNKNQGSLGPAQQQEQQADVTPENLPGKYTVKDGDTLFLIAEKYYKDGYKFSEIAKTNNINDVNSLEVGRVLDIPKLEELAQASSLPATSPTIAPSASPAPTEAPVVAQGTGTGGGDGTVWGPKITSDTYTVVEGDWLSTIAARAYGDPLSYPKIAAANNISNPDLIYPGQVLKLPR